MTAIGGESIDGKYFGLPFAAPVGNRRFPLHDLSGILDYLELL